MPCKAQRYLVVVLLVCRLIDSFKLTSFVSLQLQSVEITSAAPRVDNSQDAVAQKKLPTRYEKLQKARKKASHFHRRWKHAALLPPPPFPHNDDFVERPSGLTRNELDDALLGAKVCCCIACLSLRSSFSLTSTVSFVPPGE
jgi:hypothetical protein